LLQVIPHPAQRLVHFASELADGAGKIVVPKTKNERSDVAGAQITAKAMYMAQGARLGLYQRLAIFAGIPTFGGA